MKPSATNENELQARERERKSIHKNSVVGCWAVISWAGAVMHWAGTVMVWAGASSNTNFPTLKTPKNAKKAKCDGRTDGRTDRQTDGRADRHGDL